MRAKGRGSEPPARKKQNKTKHPIHQRKESAWLNLLPCSLATSMLTVKQGLGFSIAYFSWKSDPKLLKKKSAAHPIKFYSIIVYWARCVWHKGTAPVVSQHKREALKWCQESNQCRGRGDSPAMNALICQDPSNGCFTHSLQIFWYFT